MITPPFPSILSRIAQTALFAAGLLGCANLRAAPGDFTRDAQGVTLETSSGATRVEIWGDRVARVLHTPTKQIPAISSLAVKGTPAATSWQLQNFGTYLLVTTPNVAVRVDSPSGQVRFLSGSTTLLAESTGGTTLQATTVGNPAVASYVVTQKFDLATGEAIYGLGQHQQGVMNYVGQSVTLLQKNTEVAIPVELSNKGYALLWDNPAVTTVDVGKTTAGRLSWSSEAGDAVNYYFCYGPAADQAIAGYRNLTGAAPMFGKWAWGYWQSKERYATQQELLDVAAGYRSRGIPLDGMIQDWQYWPVLNQNTAAGGWGSHEFDPARYPDPAGMINTLHAQNIHAMISVWAKFDVTNSGTSIANLQALEAVNGAYSPAIPYVYPAGQGKWYDPFQPAARQVYWNLLAQKIFSKGMDAWWLDAPEPELSGNWGEFRTFNTALGPGAKVFNAYPLMHSSAVYEGQRAATSQKRAIILTRSAYAGQQRNAAITWSGDIDGSFSVFAAQVPAGLNFSASGIPYWNTDIGGFGSGDPATASYAELYTRWFQYGAFCPMFRSHGTNYAKEVWRFPSATQAILTNYINLRYQLMPYIYSTAWKVTNESYTMMRPLVMDFAADPQVNGIGNQYMFGPALLVNPVTTAGATSRSVYLPAGTAWYDFHTGLKTNGGQTIQAPAPIEKMPLFAKAGSIIPCGPPIQYAMQAVDPTEIRVYPGASGSFNLYEDEGDNYNYESGSYATIPFTWDETTQKLTIGNRSGSFPGMLANRTFRVVFVTPGHGVGLTPSAAPDAVVNYTGSAVAVPYTAPGTPVAPTALVASTGSAGITLVWNGPSEGFVYRVQRSLQSGGPYTTIAYPVSGTSYVDANVENGTTYYYVVSAVNNAGESGASNQVAVTRSGSALRTLLMFNEPSGSVAADGSGRGWHGSLVNSPARVVGKGGNAIDLNGTNQYASLPAGVVSTLNNCTIAAWVNLDAVQNAKIFDFGSGTNSSMSLTPKGASNVVRFAINAGGGEQQIDGTAALSPGVWNHVAVSLSGSVGILYVNGVEVGRNSNLSILPLNLGSTSQNWIGRSQSAAVPYLDGRVDDFRVYSGALAAADIQAIFNGGAGALLAPWVAQDIGSPTIPGSSGSGDGGASAMYLTASGSDIQGTSDQFRFASQTRSGDTDFVSRINTLDTANPYSKSGLMVRASLAANAANFTVVATPLNGLYLQYRTTAGGNTTSVQVPGVVAPCWLKISRSSGTFSAYRSTDGKVWTQIGSSQAVSAIPASAYYGLALTSHTNTAPVGSSVSFISVQDPPAALPVTSSASAPAIGASDRYFLASGLNDADNIGGQGITSSGANDEDTYVATDRSSKGQTFTTGSSPYGYTLGAFTFQHVLWPQFLNNGTYYDVQPNDTFAVQFGVMSNGIKSPLYVGFAKYSGAAITGSGNSGTGRFFTFDFSPAGLDVLAPNTTYYFEIAPASGGPYFELNGSYNGTYSGGTAFRGDTGADTGNIGSSVNLLTGDRVFHARLVKAPAPDYATWIAGYPGVGAQNGMNDDADGDGVTNGEEYVAGTDPANPASVLKLSVAQSNGKDFVLSFPSVPEKSYRVEWSSDLAAGSWNTLQDNLVGTGGIMTVVDANGGSQPRRFYRVVVNLN